MHRYFVTGTDTDVGKTTVAAALARALTAAGRAPTYVKIAQTGLLPVQMGDAQRTGMLSGVPYRELARFRAAADPYNAALREGAAPLNARDVVAQLAQIPGPLVVEGSGGLMVPLNAREHLGDVAAAAGLDALLVVGLRLGCINHALLTAAACERLGIPLRGAVLVERWGATASGYAIDVERALQGNIDIFGIVPFAETSAPAVVDARLFDGLL